MRINVNGDELRLKYENEKFIIDNNDNYSITGYQSYFHKNLDTDLCATFSDQFYKIKEKREVYREGSRELKELIWTILHTMSLYKEGCIFEIGCSVIDKRVDEDDREATKHQLFFIEKINSNRFLIFDGGYDSLLVLYSFDENEIIYWDKENTISVGIADCLSEDDLYNNHPRKELKNKYNVMMSNWSYCEEKLTLYLNNICKYVDVIPMSKVSAIIPSKKYEIDYFCQSIKFAFFPIPHDRRVSEILVGDNLMDKYKESVLLHEYIHSIDINTSIDNNTIFNDMVKSLMKRLKNTSYVKTLQSVRNDEENYEYINSYLLNIQELFARTIQFYYLYQNGIENAEYSLLSNPFCIPQKIINEVSVEIEEIIYYINQYSKNIRKLENNQ